MASSNSTWAFLLLSSITIFLSKKWIAIHTRFRFHIALLHWSLQFHLCYLLDHYILLLSRTAAASVMAYSWHPGLLQLLSQNAKASVMACCCCYLGLRQLSRTVDATVTFCCCCQVVLLQNWHWQRAASHCCKCRCTRLVDTFLTILPYFLIRSSPNTPKLHHKVLMFFMAKRH